MRMARLQHAAFQPKSGAFSWRLRRAAIATIAAADRG
jgi:hypothetical protein